MRTTRKLLNVQFDWRVSYPTAGIAEYVLTVKIGSCRLMNEMRLFLDKRGYYEGNEVPIVFVPDLITAKKRIEKRILAQLKQETPNL